MAINCYKITTGEIRYKATLWQNNRPLRSKSFHRKIDATEWLKRQEIREKDGIVGRLKGERMTLSEFIEAVYWPNKSIRAGTALDYRRVIDKHLVPKFGHRLIVEIAPEEWSHFLHGLVQNKMGKARVNRIHAISSAIYKIAVRWKYVAYNPLLAVDWFKEDIPSFDFWSQTEAGVFLNWAFSTDNPRYSFYQLAFETGMRISEVIALQRDCVDLERGLIHVRRSYSRAVRQLEETTKSGHKRIIGMSPGLMATLRRTIASHSSPFIFIGRNGHLKYETVQRNFTEDQEAAGLRRITIHDLRHSYASHYVMKGGSIYDLKALMGHSAIETTMRYAHLAQDHLVAKSAMVTFVPEHQGNVVGLKTPNHFPTMEEDNTRVTQPRITRDAL